MCIFEYRWRNNLPRDTIKCGYKKEKSSWNAIR